jgi:hypothetical protein
MMLTVIGGGACRDVYMKFERTPKYEQKLFEQALFDEKNVIKDADITIVIVGSKYKAYCHQSDTYLVFPRSLRRYDGQRYVADVVEVKRDDNVSKYYRVFPNSIREYGSDEIVK